MKLNFKRITAMFLSVLMIVGMFPVSVFADFTLDTAEEYVDAYVPVDVEEDADVELAVETTNVAKIGEAEYATFAEALAAANAGDTITFVADITEDVTVTKAVTIDGAGKTYTGAMTLKADTTIKNVNFDGKGYNGYAVETRGANYLTIEDCTAKNYGYGFVQTASGTALTTVKNVTVSNMNYGVKVDYSGAVVLENVDITAAVAAVLNSNYGEKTITIKNSKLNILGTWTRNNTLKTNYVFEGANTVGKFITDAAIDNFKLAAESKLTAPEGITVTTGEGVAVPYKNGAYSVVEEKNYVAQIGDTKYTSLQEAINACENGETVKLLTDITYTGDDVVNAIGGATGFGKYPNPCILYVGGTPNTPSSVNAVIDLNGHTIKNTADAYFIMIMDNAKVVFTDSVGGGEVITTADAPAVWVIGTETLVTIKGGYYETAFVGGVLHATHGGDLVIEGGEFNTTAENKSLLIMLNSKDRQNSKYFISGVATVTIKGGIFQGFNPSKVGDDNGATSIENIKFVDGCAEGFAPVKNNEGNYSVVEAVAKIGETKYATVEEAFAAATNGETVELIADTYEDIVIPAEFGGTLAIGTCTINSITNNSATAKIVINGNVVVENANGSAITGEVISISGNGTLTAIANGDHAYGIGGDNTKSITVENVHILKVQGGHYGEIGTDTKYYKDAPEGGAAIGSGSNGAVITLTNVTIDKALGGSKAAGIGALYHTGVTINITGCKIARVEGGTTAAAIGGSRVSRGATASEAVTINIQKSTITKAVGGAYAAGIGSGYDTHCQANQPICTINIDGSTINATGGKYAAGIGTGYHNAGLAGEIKNSTITATSGEKVYKDKYTSAQDIGFGVADLEREGSNNDSYVIYNGTKIALPRNVAQIGEEGYETLADAVAAAANGDEIKIIVAGTYKVPAGKNITITGAVDGVVFDNIGAHNMGGASVTFNNVTFNYTNENYKGLQHSGDLVYNNCTINGQVFLYGTSETFNNCTFNQTSSGAYNVWTYSAKDVDFNECTFNSAGKSVLIYHETASVFNDVTFTKSTLNASAAVDGKAAIEMDSSLTAGIKLTIDAATTATGFGTGNVSGNSLWNNKKGNNTPANNDITVVVDNVTVLAPVTFVAKIGEVGYETLADAVAAANNGDTIKVVADHALTWDGNTKIDGLPVIVAVEEKNVTIDLNGKKLTGTSGDKNNALYAAFAVDNDGSLTLKDSVGGGSVSITGKNTMYSLLMAYEYGANNATKLIVEGGSYYLETAHDSLIFCGQRADDLVYIKGGNFELGNVGTGENGKPWIFNVVGSGDGHANITGGTFNADINNQFWSSEAVVDKACYVDNNGDGTWTVKPGAVAYISVGKLSGPYYTPKDVGFKTFEEVLEAAKNEGNVVITLLDNVTLDITAWDALAIGGDVTETITINGNGKTLTFNKLNSDWNHVATKNDAKLVLNNMTITDSGKNNGPWNRYDINFACDVELNNVTSTKALAFKADATLNNVTINEEGDNYAIWVQANGQKVTINGLTVTSAGRGIKIDEQYVDAAEKVTLNVSNATFTTAKKAAIMVKSAAGANIALENVDITNVVADTVNAVWNDEDSVAYFNNITVTGGNIVQEGVFVAKIGDNYYKTLADALVAAADGATIELLWNEGDAPIAMNGALYGKTVTITGTATVDWSKGFLFVGRGGAGNGEVIFDNANLTSASNSASYGIHVSGREKNTSNKYDGILKINDSVIELDYLINKGEITLDNSTLTVKNGFAIGGRPASETESGEDATATISLTNGSKVVVNNHNGMGLGYEAIGVMNIDATSAFETTQSFLVTAKGTMNVAGNVTVVGTLTNNGAIVLTDAAATVNANECGNVTTTVAGYEVDYADGKYTVKEVVLSATIAAKSATLLYDDMIQIRYRFAVTGDGIAEYGMLVFDNKADADAHDASKAIQQKELVEYTDGYYGYTDGIAAKEMGDSQFVVGYVKLDDGNYVYGNTVEYSPKKYAENMVGKNTTDAKTKALCNALMNYGAAAQVKFGYKTDALMNVGFDAVAYDASVLGESIFSVDTTETNGFTTKAATLIFEGAITYRIKYAANETISNKTLYLEYSVKGTTDSVEMQLIDGAYYGYIAGIAPKDMDEALTAKPYYIDESGAKVYGAELVYSGYEYARRTIENSKSEDVDVALAEAFAMYVYNTDAAIAK